MDVLLERVEVEQREHFASRVVRPERRDHFFFHGTSVTTKKHNIHTRLPNVPVDANIGGGGQNP